MGLNGRNSDFLRVMTGAAFLVATASGCAAEDATAVTSFGETESAGGITDSGITDSGAGSTSSGDESTTGDDTGISAGETNTTTTTGDTDGPVGCQSSDDCTDDPAATVCNTDTGECVGCTADEDACLEGTYCDAINETCVEGCLVNGDCGEDLVCNTDTNECEGCVVDADCPLGTVCEDGTCESGCTPQQACQPGLACCSGDCVDIDTDTDHCGGCDTPCAPAAAVAECVDGTCGIASCNANFQDCNMAANDGCEINGVCACDPGSMQACYTGTAGTADVGACVSGTQVCNDEGTGWGPCENQVLPVLEICNNGVDDNCDGDVDEDPDDDLDGWTVCGGDCCDVVGANCLNPALVNPGAFEFGGNMVDDDCDGNIDNILGSCDNGLVSNTGTIDDYARAIDLCQFTELNPVNPEDRTWGVISTGMFLADGSVGASANSRSIRNGFGQFITPQAGQRLAVLSTGHAADSADTNPGFAQPQPGIDTGTSSFVPTNWLVANGNTIPNAPGCPAPTETAVQNPVMFEVQVRVPTNAQSFSVNMYFMSAEYPEWVCTFFNDFFITLIESNATNTADGNIAIYNDGVDTWPVGVNILDAAPGLFTQCENGAISQCSPTPATYAGCTGTNDLNGTGYDLTGPVVYTCEPDARHGGGTGWLTMSGNVEPGEIMTLQFVIWDTNDPFWDSHVLLDDFVWSVNASEPGVTPN